MEFGYQKMYIGGALVDSVSKTRSDVICPADGKYIAQIAEAGKADAEKAIEAAQKGFEFWSKCSLSERTQWMLKLREAVLKRTLAEIRNCL